MPYLEYSLELVFVIFHSGECWMAPQHLNEYTANTPIKKMVKSISFWLLRWSELPNEDFQN